MVLSSVNQPPLATPMPSAAVPGCALPSAVMRQARCWGDPGLRLVCLAAGSGLPTEMGCRCSALSALLLSSAEQPTPGAAWLQCTHRDAPDIRWRLLKSLTMCLATSSCREDLLYQLADVLGNVRAKPL